MEKLKAIIKLLFADKFVVIYHGDDDCYHALPGNVTEEEFTDIMLTDWEYEEDDMQ